MKKIFTTAVVLCIAMQIGSFAQKPKVFAVNKAEQHHQEKLAELKKAHETTQEVMPVKPTGLLKSAQAAVYPLSMVGYNWFNGAWQPSSETQFDAQGRPTQQVLGNSRDVYEYIDIENKRIVYYQKRIDDASPWVTESKQIVMDSDNEYLSEYYIANSEGVLELVNGNKSSETQTVDGNISTYEYKSWTYNVSEKQYLVENGYKRIQEVLVNGNFSSDEWYNWVGGDWKLLSSREFVYNESGRLESMNFYDGEDDVLNRIELVYSGSEEPNTAYEYSVSADGSVSVLMGRYIDLVWYNWAAMLKDGELEPSSGIEQDVIDPDGDKYDAANYVNLEKFESGEDADGDEFYRNYTWIGGAWVLTAEYKEELQPDGTIIVTDWEVEYDIALDAIVGGDKEIRVVDGENRTETQYAYDTENLIWKPTSKEEVIVLFGGDGYERTDYIFVGGENEWEKEYYYKRVDTPVLSESKSEYYDNGQLTSSYHRITEYDSYGNTTRYVTDNFRVDNQYNSETEQYELVNVYSYSEEVYENIYEDGKLMVVTQQRRDAKDGVFVNQSKNVYSYTPTAVGSLSETALMEVVSTIVDNTLLVKVYEPGVVELVDARGKVCAKQQVQVGLTQIPVSNLANGVGFVKMTGANGKSQTVKVIKK
jgi:hypothetical protein